MPLTKGTDLKSCISENYKEMIRAGHPKNQAQAAALNHCHGIYGGAPKKKDKKNELIFLRADLELEEENIATIKDELTKEKNKLM